MGRTGSDRKWKPRRIHQLTEDPTVAITTHTHAHTPTHTDTPRASGWQVEWWMTDLQKVLMRRYDVKYKVWLTGADGCVVRSNQANSHFLLLMCLHNQKKNNNNNLTTFQPNSDSTFIHHWQVLTVWLILSNRSSFYSKICSLWTNFILFFVFLGECVKLWLVICVRDRLLYHQYSKS